LRWVKRSPYDACPAEAAALFALEEIFMRTARFALALVCAGSLLGVSQAEAKPGGCLKYGAAGAVAGHYAGHHAFKGAVAGCLAGIARRHHYNEQLKREKEEAAKKASEPTAPADSTPSTDTHSSSPPPDSTSGQKY
jgi:hypothetical protein